MSKRSMRRSDLGLDNPAERALSTPGALPVAIDAYRCGGVWPQRALRYLNECMFCQAYWPALLLGTVCRGCTIGVLLSAFA